MTTPNLTAELAGDLVQRYMLAPGQEITRIRRLGDAFIVESEDWWHVETIESWPNFQKSELYELCEVRLYISADPPPAPHGFGMPQGRITMFHLNDADQFHAFFATLDGRFSAVELAGLLTRYADSEGAGAQALILTTDDLRGLLYPEHLLTLAEPIRFSAVPGADDMLTVDFASYYVMPADESHANRIALNRWHVEAHHSTLNWEVEPLAVGMPSPFYE